MRRRTKSLAGPNRELRYVVWWIGFDDGAAVLDIGCGSGVPIDLVALVERYCVTGLWMCLRKWFVGGGRIWGRTGEFITL